MIRSYFTIAWRNMIKGKGYSALNIFGLAMGMAVALLIGLWAYREYSFDKFLPDYQRIYKVQRNFNSNGEILTFATTSLRLAETLKTQVPEIEYVAESDWMGSHGLIAGNKKFYLNGGIVGVDFLKIFQYPFKRGNAATVFRDPYSIALTESAARTLFGSEDPLNKMVRFNNANNLRVTAILKDLPSNTSFKFNYLVPFSYLDQTESGVREQRSAAGSFGNNNLQQFVKLRAGASYERVMAKIKDIEKTETTNYNAMKSDVILQPMSNWHLYSAYKNGVETGGYIEYVRIFCLVGALVLLIACINFINLSTARSEKRAKEVGIRKAIGSLRKDIIIQFLAEAFLLSLLAFIVCIGVVQLALPAFNSLIAGDIRIPFGNAVFWIIALLSVMITALLAGSRPAFYLSSFRPVKVLRGSLNIGGGASFPRKALVVLQFSCSVALIISTIIIYQQVQYAKERPTGFDIRRVVMTDMSDDLVKNYTALKGELLGKGIVSSVAVASSPATDIYWHTDIDRWPGKDPGESIEMGVVVTSKDYFNTLGIRMHAGRDFEGPADSTSVIFNETAVKRMRIDSPVGQTITWNGRQLRIIGVAKDALMVSPFASPDPTMFAYNEMPGGNCLYNLSEKVNTSQALQELSVIFNKYNPAYPYEYRFADQEYANKFNLELLIGRLAAIFAGLAIFISCLGLFGLAAYVAEQRTKEIGIRKVLGATVSQVWFLLSREFIVLVVFGSIIATPAALYFLNDWLQKYTYRISIGPGVFIWAATIAIIITLITISFQSVKAALMNPVKSLRSE